MSSMSSLELCERRLPGYIRHLSGQPATPGYRSPLPLAPPLYVLVFLLLLGFGFVFTGGGWVRGAAATMGQSLENV